MPWYHISDNLALNKPQTFEPTQTATPGNDGNPSTCINMPPTAVASARFLVDLGSVRRIKEVNVTFPAGKKEIRGRGVRER
jgi:hypothetical protein